MAAGTQSDFVIYDEEFYGGMTETLQQNADAFNEASRNAMRLVPRRLKGQYEKESFVDVISGIVSRRDTTSTSDVADTAMTQDEFIGVKINRRLGPIAQTIDAWRKIAEDRSEMSFLLGEQAGQAVAEDYLNSALRSLEAALDNQAALEHDATDGTIATSDLADGLSKMGDRFGRVVAWVMHSKPYFDLVKEQISSDVVEIGAFNVRNGTPVTMGRPVIVSDSSALVETDGVSSGTDAYSTLGLVAGAAEVAESEDREQVTDMVTGKENLLFRWQGEYAFNLALKGFKWDTTNGGTNPNDSALATGTNWDKAVTSDKLLPGFIIKSQ